MNVEIRTAVIGDLFAVMRLVKEASDNTGEAGRHPALDAMDADLSAEALRKYIENEFVIVAAAEDRIVGALVVDINTVDWSGQKFLTNRFLYVSPEARSVTNAGLSLLAEMRATSEEAGIPFLFYLTDAVDPQRKAAILERIGFKLFGLMCLFNPAEQVHGRAVRS